MKAMVGRTIQIAFLCSTLMLLLVACTPNASDYILSPAMGAQMAADAAEEMMDLADVEPTPEPARLADLTEDEIVAGLDPAFAEMVLSADPAAGEMLSLTNGCIGCHALDPETVMTGPTWHHMGDIAAARIEGVSPGLYLYTSIVDPELDMVADYPSNIMPQNFSELLSDEDLATLVAYLLSQAEE